MEVQYTDIIAIAIALASTGYVAWLRGLFTQWPPLIIQIALLVIVGAGFFALGIGGRGWDITTAGGWQNILLIIAGVIGATFTYWRISVLDEQRKISEQSLYTDSYIRAVEQLGKDEKAVRLGGIGGLGRIAKENETYRRQIIELLCAYIVDKASTTKLEEQTLPSPPEMPKPPPADILAILDIVNDNRKEWEKWEGFRPKLQYVNFQNMDLSHSDLIGFDFQNAHLEKAQLQFTHLEGANLAGAYLKEVNLVGAYLKEARLEGANLERALLAGTRLEGARLMNAHLESARLTGAHLERVYLTGAHLESARLAFAYLEEAHLEMAHLEGADLTRAHLEKANLMVAHLEGADLANAYLQAANLAGANMLGAKNLTQEQINKAFGDGGTKLPGDLTAPPHWPKEELDMSENIEEWLKWRKDKKNYQPPQ